MTHDPTLLGGMTVAAFLAGYWQKQPLVLRRALLVQDAGPAHADLLVLAALPHVSSRLIVAPRELEQQPEGDPLAGEGWALRNGPFTAGDFEGLPDDRWTLLVQEADRHLPSCRGLLERFRFVPNWRLDDVMVSYAADGGGVGAHLDRYDVFLVQTAGRRRWRIESAPRSSERLDPTSPIPRLVDFRPDQEWVLEPGDALYLPPRIPHEGVALGPCVTCSVGFRVPDPRELCAGYVRQLGPGVFDAVRYSDPGLTEVERPGEIAAEARDALRASTRRLFDDTQGFDRWLGRLVTTPLRGLPGLPGEQGSRGAAAAGLWERLDRGEGLQRSAAPHFAWFRDDDGDVQLFVGGERYRLEAGSEASAELLCGREPLDADTLLALAENERLAGVLLDLVRRGFLA